MAGEGEFEYIARRLAPLSAGFPGAFELKDDAAVIAPSAGCELVVTTDTVVAGRHFPDDEDPAIAARKALRVNLSDLAAMGARPLAYLTSVVWPHDADRTLMDGFADGLEAERAVWALPLIGGDTTSGPGPWTITITALGECPAGRAVRRRGARAGDRLLVTGTIGDGRLGLESLGGEAAIADPEDAAWLEDRYRLPQPRLAIVEALREHAHAAVDVSDGLIADVGHIAESSGVAAAIELNRVPLSGAARRWAEAQPDAGRALARLASGGDDYELACAVAPENVEGFARACAEQGVDVTEIGRFREGDGGVTVTINGAPVDIEQAGFTHF
ncbi:thiamine-phosphate kinase [Marinicauda salina]|uniref:Thiamine-monophosphate kinase n=1 Tax=Marinicauda salina TaxID=2135793 RepID=A0A2U2BVD6_9PROT|nr:thiamine-phosphate kinase [Marinicauda salina]PWE17991.1 thiamine-phosphate kinase [Marinicauda salina]